MPTVHHDPYQHHFARLHGRAMYEEEQRLQKARKVVAVIADHAGDRVDELHTLDLGCSTGIITGHISRAFRITIGVDIDVEALKYAAANRPGQVETTWFLASDAMAVPFGNNAFDVVICAHVYEHVPDARRMVAEIHRVLKPGGICFFSAGNRLSFMEPHYRVPFLSILPKAAAHRVMKSLGKGDHYYEKHLSYWGLKRLLSSFEIIDYTRRVIDDPERFAATDVCPPGSRRQRLASLVAKMAYGLIPTYIFLLKKAPS
ncbi:MAG: class I SAM-dependent methyltransferase [Syntrophobacteraceae bacterium]|jgi:2-polyprenyl-3-methyl-5-hydroxy-6-metoxy-1,4-benzoquinol methylase|nr:class I SAM-dependent methyltransferase [Syntrophobacteraceae bacterium]